MHALDYYIWPNFGHARSETIEFWKRLVREALSLSTPTPFYIFSALPIAERISELDAALDSARFQFNNWKSAIENWFSPLALLQNAARRAAASLVARARPGH